MPHPRHTLRHETATRLAALPDFANKVFAGRYLPLTPEALPAICVYTLRNSARREGAQTQPTFRDTTTLAIEIYLKGAGADVEDQMDALINTLEHGLLGDSEWRQACGIECVDGIDTQYKIETKGEAPFIAAQMAVDVQWRSTFPPNGVVPLKGFSLAHIQIEGRDPLAPWPPEGWRESPFLTVDLPQL